MNNGLANAQEVVNNKLERPKEPMTMAFYEAYFYPEVFVCAAMNHIIFCVIQSQKKSEKLWSFIDLMMQDPLLYFPA